MRNMQRRALPPVGIIGAGAMGRGLVQLFARSARPVRFFDSRSEATKETAAFVRQMLGKVAAREGWPTEQLEETLGCLQPCREIADLAGCELVIEAVIEDLAVKRQLFAELEALLPAETLLASNTSSFLIAEIATACRHQERVAGLHFFNPVPLMRLVEVIPGVRTAPVVVHRLVDIVTSTGHHAVIAADQPGFLVNHAGRGLYTEGLRMLEEQVAEPPDIDAVLREACGFRMGPFELLDLTGLDVSGPVMESIYSQFHQEPRFRPSSLIRPRIAAGLLGRKSGAGFYAYDGTKPVAGAKGGHSRNRATPPVWVDPRDSTAEKLKALLTENGAGLASSPDDPQTILIVQPWGDDATHACVERGLDPRRCVALDPLPSLTKRRTMMLTSATSEWTRDVAHALFARDGTPVTVINDSTGFIAQRTLATIVNIACDIAQRRIATVEDIETAIPLALGYPHGPLSWGDAIGPARILKILERMSRLSRDPRYRPSPWLRRRAALGLPLVTPEAPRMPGQEIRTAEQ